MSGWTWLLVTPLCLPALLFTSLGEVRAWSCVCMAAAILHFAVYSRREGKEKV